MTALRFIAASAVFFSFAANAQPVSVPYTFTNGQIADAVEVNDNFTALVNGINSIVVGTNQISDGAVTTDKIGNFAVTGPKIGFYAVGADNIAVAAVGNLQLNTSAVTTDKIADSAVGNNQLKSNLILKGNVSATGDITAVAINLTSDRNAKEAFQPVNAREVLDKVAALPISEWQYKTQSDVRHIGPMAQDFRAAFALGIDDTHITSVDADGVALAAIKGLNEKLEERDAEIALLHCDNEALNARLLAIERHLGVSTGDKVVSN